MTGSRRALTRRWTIKIDYPGVNNFTQFSFDGLGRNTKITETVSGSVTSTKQFVWCFDKFARNRASEERDATGNLARRFYSKGETIGVNSYFFTKNHLRSVAEMTDSAGTIQSQYAYDPFGKQLKKAGSLDADFGFANYYLHTRSGLSLTRMRAYSSSFGRFISRDPIHEKGGLNLFAYVNNKPIQFTDPSGRDQQGHVTNFPESTELPSNIQDAGDPGAGTQDGGGSDGGGSGPPKPPCSDPSKCDQQTVPRRQYQQGDAPCSEGDGHSCCVDEDGTLYDPCGNKVCGTGPAQPPAPTPQA